MLTYGIDISHWQPTENWAQVVGAGIHYAIAKATEGTGFVDDTYTSHASGMRAVHIDIPGAYHMLRGGGGALQADHFINVVDGATHDIEHTLLALDIEASDATWADVQAFAVQFWKRLPDHPLIAYLPDWEYARIGSPNIAKLGMILWRAGANSAYAPASGTFSSIAIPTYFWSEDRGGFTSVPIDQFTDKGTVPGIPGTLDCDAIQMSLADFRALVLPSSTAVLAASSAGEDMLNVNRGTTFSAHAIIASGVNIREQPGLTGKVSRTTSQQETCWYLGACIEDPDWRAVVFETPDPKGAGPFLTAEYVHKDFVTFTAFVDPRDAQLADLQAKLVAAAQAQAAALADAETKAAADKAAALDAAATAARLAEAAAVAAQKETDDEACATQMAAFQAQIDAMGPTKALADAAIALVSLASQKPAA